MTMVSFFFQARPNSPWQDVPHNADIEVYNRGSNERPMWLAAIVKDGHRYPIFTRDLVMPNHSGTALRYTLESNGYSSKLVG